MPADLMAPAAPATPSSMPVQQKPIGAPPPPGPLASVAPMPAPKMASMADAWARTQSWRSIIRDMQAAGQDVPAHVHTEYSNAMKSLLAHGTAHASSAVPVAQGAAHAAQQMGAKVQGMLRPAPSATTQLGRDVGVGALGGLGAMGVYQLGRSMLAPKTETPPGGV
jgi:hypothetical protein